MSQSTPPPLPKKGSNQPKPQKNEKLHNMMVRILVAVPAMAVLMSIIWWGPVWSVQLLVALTGAYGYHEFLKMAVAGRGLALPVWRLTLLGALPGLGLLLPMQELGMALGLLAAAVPALWWTWFAGDTGAKDGKGDAWEAGVTALAGLVLVPWFTAHIGLIVALSPGGNRLLAWLVLVLVLNDSLAYFVGISVGRTPLMPKVSPKKTVEGSLGGLAGGLLAGYLGWTWTQSHEGIAFSLPLLLILGTLTALAGQAGDLLESRLKRLLGVKDSGRFLPGHGGLLDRLDAFLLAAPALYYLMPVLKWLVDDVILGQA